MRRLALTAIAIGLGLPAAMAQSPPADQARGAAPPPSQGENPAAVAPRTPGIEVAPPPVPAPAGADETPPPILKSEVPKFFVIENGAPVGPMPLEQVQQRVRAGQITRKTGVWKVGTPNAWADAEKVPELAGLFPEAPPPPDLTRQFRDFLPGVWEMRVNNPGLMAVSKTTVRYREDGHYAGTISTSYTTAPTLPPYVTPLAGTWDVQGIDDHRFSLTLTPNQGQPSTYSIATIDRNHLRDETDNAIATRVSR
jgi:hypothetical protein